MVAGAGVVVEACVMSGLILYLRYVGVQCIFCVGVLVVLGMLILRAVISEGQVGVVTSWSHPHAGHDGDVA